MGVHLGLPSEFSAVEWYGRGPHENYSDRKYGAYLRRHAVKHLEQLHTPYIFTGARPACMVGCGVYVLSLLCRREHFKSHCLAWTRGEASCTGFSGMVAKAHTT